MNALTIMMMLMFCVTAMGAVKGEEVSYSEGGLEMKGYLAYDDSFEGKRPGVLVVHEWWGQNSYARMRADKLAEMGYVALAVDMYGDGKQADHPDDAGKFAAEAMKNLEVAKARFEKAMELLKKNENTDPNRIAAIGYCFGGSVVLNMARLGVDLRGVASFHGGLGTQMPAEKGKISAAVLVCNGAADGFVPQTDIDAIKEEMKNAEADFKFINYEGAVHSFTNPGADVNGEKFNLPLAYNKEADEKSWAEMKTFFERIFKD